MTTIEHTMLGAAGLLATGLHRRLGWQAVALAGVAANLPDWDGATFLGGMRLFDQAHRAWGHGLLPCIAVAIVLGLIDYRWDIMTRIGRPLARRLRVNAPAEQMAIRTHFTMAGAAAWMLIASAAALSHLPADMIVSGGRGYSNWGIQALWPFSDRAFLHPMVPWGDPGIVIVLSIGLVAMARRPKRTQTIAVVTLSAVALYAVVRGSMGS